MKPLTFATLFPHARSWMQDLVHVWPAYVVKPNYAIYEVFHIFAIVLLGGTSVLVGLRLIGRGLTEEPPSEVYRNVRPLLNLGVALIIVSGVLIGMANAERIYDSAAFLAKMLALLAGVTFTYGVVRPVALADGAASLSARVWAAASAVIYLGVLWVFVTGGLITPGLLHPLTAATLVVLAAVGGRARWVFASGVLVIVGAMYLATHVFIAPDDLAHADAANVLLSCLLGVWVVGFALHRGARSVRRAQGGGLTQAVGYGCILVWVTAAAAGRWIAFA